jgi:uncharacterized protein (TIGR03086 family)
MIDLQPAAGRIAGLVAAVSDDQLDAPTPCVDTRLGDLLAHVDRFARSFAAAAAKERGPLTSQPPPRWDVAQLGADWRVRIPDQLTALGAAWTDPAAWEGTTQIGGGEMPAEGAGLAALDELVVHGWDVARASGQPFECDRSALEACLGFVVTISPPERRTGGDGLFEPAVDVPADALLLDRLIGLTGRDPAWAP